MRHVRVERDDTPVMFVAAEADPRMVSDAAQHAFNELESRLGALRGRRFFGVFNPASSEYLACVQTKDGDDAGALGLSQTVIPGGAYLRATITGQPPEVYALIAPGVEELEKQGRPDPDRPLIEFYRRRTRAARDHVPRRRGSRLQTFPGIPLSLSLRVCLNPADHRDFSPNGELLV